MQKGTIRKGCQWLLNSLGQMKLLGLKGAEGRDNTAEQELNVLLWSLGTIHLHLNRV